LPNTNEIITVAKFQFFLHLNKTLAQKGIQEERWPAAIVPAWPSDESWPPIMEQLGLQTSTLTSTRNLQTHSSC